MNDGAHWILDAPADPRRFPTVRHRHPNGTLDAVRDPVPVRPRPGDDRGATARGERWRYACACGEVYVWERRVT